MNKNKIKELSNLVQSMGNYVRLTFRCLIFIHIERIPNKIRTKPDKLSLI